MISLATNRQLFLERQSMTPAKCKAAGAKVDSLTESKRTLNGNFFNTFAANLDLHLALRAKNETICKAGLDLLVHSSFCDDGQNLNFHGNKII